MRFTTLASLALLSACASDPGRAATTSLTSGEARPQKPPESRTIDSAGYVDNAGRTSDETTGRPETSGARATETGDDRPTGTNTGVPNGARVGAKSEQPIAPRSAEVMPRGGLSPVAGYDDTSGRMARALCDHEASCERIGAGKAWPSDDACVFGMRDRVIADLDAMDCRVDGRAVPLCLSSLRRVSCETVIDRATSIDDCARLALCAR